MATLPTGIVVSTTGNYSINTEEIGGAAVGITSATTITAGSPITRVLTIADTVASGIDLTRSVPKELSGVAHSYSAKPAYEAGTFARDAASTEWLVRTVATTINGVANNTLKIVGNEQDRARTLVTNSQKGAQTSTAYRAGYWNSVGIARQRTNWSTGPSSNNVTYRLPTDNTTDSADQALFVTYKSVPGELTYHYGSGAEPTTDEYKARTL